MSENFPNTFNREIHEDTDLLSTFNLPRTNKSIVHSSYVRADLSEALNQNTKISFKLISISRHLMGPVWDRSQTGPSDLGPVPNSEDRSQICKTKSG